MNYDSEKSFIACPCGFRASGSPSEAQRAYRRHDCQLHGTEESRDWPGVVGFIAFLVFLSFVCTNGWGYFS